MRGLRRESGQVRGPAGKRGRVPGSFEFFMRSGVSRFLAVPGNTFPRGGLVLIGGGGGGVGGGGGGWVWGGFRLRVARCGVPGHGGGHGGKAPDVVQCALTIALKESEGSERARERTGESKRARAQ